VDAQPIPRWFEVDGGTPIFDLVVEPVDYDDLMNREFTEFEVLPVGPENGGAEEGFLPRDVVL